MSEDPESRILVISATLDQARAAVKLIKAFVDNDHNPSELPTSDIIPWTIRNKYYSAGVHFHLVEYAHWNPQSALRVPAVIFVWTRGQPYAEHVFALQNDLVRFEPEVALAIGLGREPPHHDDPSEGHDSFLADHGFEYIDGERTHHPEMPSASATEEKDGANEDEDEDVQGLPRVIDALSTIMWPTMVRERNNSTGVGKRKSQLRPSLVDFDDVLRGDDGEVPGEEETLAALMEADAADLGVPLTRASRLQREMQALERWLIENEEMNEAEFGKTGDDQEEEEEHEEGDAVNDSDGDGDALLELQPPIPDIHAPSGDDPWAAASSASIAPPSRAQHPSATPSSGFDDDFSAFVSAPPTVPGPVCGLASASISALMGSMPPARHLPHTLSPTLLKPSHTGGSFRSLRSAVSDVDIGDDVSYGYEALDDRSSLNFSPEHDHERTRVFDDDADPRISTGRRFGVPTTGMSDDPFDLTDVLGTLKTMREDIAGIENEEERKAATARFASEFVFKRMGTDEEEREKVED